MHVLILRPGEPGKSSLAIDAMVAALTSDGVSVSTLYPEQLPKDAPLPKADVVVLKDKTPLGREWGRRFHAAGVPTLSPYPATELCRDKLATNQRLAAAGLPVPECRKVERAEDIWELLAAGPVILKPIFGSQGKGIVVVEGPDEVPASLEGLMVQRYFAPDGLDRKIYRIGDEVFCIERVWPPKTLEEKQGRLIDLDERTLAVARACGDVIGSDVYGVDIIEHDGQPWIVDLSSFPGFKGVPDVGAKLAQVVEAAGRPLSPDAETRPLWGR